MISRPSRRLFIAGAGSLALGGCDLTQTSEKGAEADSVAGKANVALGVGRDVSYQQASAMPPPQLAPEYPASAITKFFKPNGSIDPKDPAYKKLAGEQFASFSMPVGGLVEAPRSFTLADLKGMPSRTQVTRHDCVEGWSCIGQWTGVPLKAVLDTVKPKPEARYVLFRCFDSDDTDTSTEPVDLSQLDEPPTPFYGSINMTEAVHPQTLLAYAMNGQPLPVANGAPVRLRLERQLGYKNTKYIKSIELVSSFADIGGGKGGYWEDQGYEWYAGI